MPPVITAVATWLFNAGIFSSMAWATWAATFVVNAAAAFALSAVMGRQATARGFAAEAMGRTHVVRSTVQPRNIIYGECVTSGPLIFAATTDGVKTNGKPSKNSHLHLVIALASHEVDAIGEVWLNDRPIGLTYDTGGAATREPFAVYRDRTESAEFRIEAGVSSITLPEDATVISVMVGTGSWDSEQFLVNFTQSGRVISFEAAGFSRVLTVTYEIVNEWRTWVTVHKHLGGPNQEADPRLMAACPNLWTAAHRLQGIAYVYVKLIWNHEVFVTGIPNIKVQVRGKRVLDPRSGITAYSNNWALCMYDYLRAPEGLGCGPEDIDVSSVVHAANVSDELVEQRNGGAILATPRYRCNGVVLLDTSPEENLRRLATAGGGPVPVLAGGVFRVHAGAFDIPTVTLTEDDLRGPIKVRPRHSRRDLFNAVKGIYIEGENTWLPVDFPKVKNALYASQDGEEIVRDIELPFTTNSTMAQRLAKIALERHRQGITVEFPAKLSAFNLAAWDTVNLRIAKFGWHDKVFRVVEWKFATDTGGVDLILAEESPTAYSWNLGDETTTDPAPDTNLPRPGPTPALTGLAFESGTEHLTLGGDGTLLSRLLVKWNEPESAFFDSATVEIEYRRSDSTRWIFAGTFPAGSERGYIASVQDRIYYNVRARLVSRRGVVGPWREGMHRVIGKTAPPSNVPWFLMDGDRLTWGAVPDLDLSGYRIRFQYGTNRSWSDAVPLHTGLLTQSPYTPELRPQGTITLMIKAVDMSGNESGSPAYILAGFGDAVVANVVEVFDFKALGYADHFFEEI